MITSQRRPRSASGTPSLPHGVKSHLGYNRVSSSVDRPSGHVLGHAIGEAAAESFSGRPRGHVVGHAIGEAPAESFAGHPRGHVIGRAIGEAPTESFSGRPHGQVVGHATHALTSTPTAWSQMTPDRSENGAQTEVTEREAA